MNPSQRTLQSEFELALFRCNFLKHTNFGFPYKYSWSTSGRTDKGVHACAQVCSAKIEFEQTQTMDDVVNELNGCLPEDIRVLDVNRVSKPFCAKTQRDRVRYQYMIPSFVFHSAGEVREMLEKNEIGPGDRHIAERVPQEDISKLQAQMDTYRASPQQLSLLKDALKLYEGTHSFHNFSKGVRNDEARSARYIVSFVVEDPIVFENGTEWIPTQVLGQSFLLHQIRKMVWMAIEVTRGVVPLSFIERAFNRDEDINICPAPPQGLYLDMSFYGGYNRRKHSNPDLPDLDWTKKDSDVYRRWKTFRNGVLMKHVVDEEKREGNFVNFIAIQEFSNHREKYKLDEEKVKGAPSNNERSKDKDDGTGDKLIVENK